MNVWGQLAGEVALPQSSTGGRVYHMDPPKATVKPAARRPKRMHPTIVNLWGLNSVQCQVAQLTADGLSNIEIAEALGIGIGTIEPHMRRIKARMGNVNRVRVAVLWDRFIRHDGEQ